MGAQIWRELLANAMCCHCRARFDVAFTRSISCHEHAIGYVDDDYMSDTCILLVGMPASMILCNISNMGVKQEQAKHKKSHMPQ